MNPNEQLNELDHLTRPNEGLRELALFAGAGGGILGGKLLGWRTICAVEWEPYPASVLVARQNDGILAPFPIWDDVRTFDGRPWRGRVDVVSGGFPCQDISCAGKGAGIDGERSGMWVEMARIIREVAPRYVFVENSPMLTSRGLGRVLGDLAEMGFNARWGVFSAWEVGADHLRERLWVVASDNREERVSRNEQKSFLPKPRVSRSKNGGGREDIKRRSDLPESVLLRRTNDVADYVDRISAIGNGQVPAVAALAFQLLSTNQETK
jgi:DNA (cytosine-5)-methyltransferase 1